MGNASSRRDASLTRRLLLSVAVLGTSAALAGLGTAASWTDATDVATGSLETGTVEVTMNGGNNFSTAIAALAPGDTIQRTVDLVNAGTLALSEITLGAAGTGDFADLAPHLTLTVDRCSEAWTDGGLTYTCLGTKSSVASGTLSALAADAASMSALDVEPGDTNHLRFKLALDLTAPLSTSGQSSTVTYTTTAVQRAGMDR